MTTTFSQQVAHRLWWALPVAMLFLSLTGQAQAACDTSICVGSATACTVSGTHNIGPDCNCTFDWSGKDVTVTGTINGDGCCYLILADDLTVQGGTLRARGGCADATITGNFTTSKSGGNGGNIDVRETGSTTITAAGSATLNGVAINANAESGFFGGDIDIAASSVSGATDFVAVGIGGADGGTVTVTSTSGNVNLTSSMDVSGGGEAGYGGDITVDAATTLAVGASNKSLQSQGSQSGDGGFVTLTASDGTATINGAINTNGNGEFAFGGIIEASGSSVTTGTTWNSRGDQEGDGGEIFITGAAGTITTTNGSSIFNTVGGSGGGWGGDIDLDATSTVTLAGDIDSSGNGTDASAGDISVVAGTNHTLTVQSSSRIETDSSGAGSDDGFITLSACNISIAGTLDSRNNSLGTNDMTYQGTFTAQSGSNLLADNDGGNDIFCRCVDVALPIGTCDTPLACQSNPTLSGTVTPAAVTSPILLPACG